MSTFATDVIAGDADSTGNGRMVALGNGSSAGAVAVALNCDGRPLSAATSLEADEGGGEAGEDA
jgi:hypothetical protein